MSLDRGPVLIVDDAFIERLPDALHDPAVNLTADNGGVDLRAAVVNRDITF